MTYKEIQKKLEKCELALTSIQNGTYTNGKLSEKEALNKLTTIKESLEKKLNLLKEEEGRITTDDPAQAEKLAKKGIDVDLKEDEEAEEENIDTIHTELVAQEIHKALVDALQEKGSEVSDHSISSLYPENFTIGVRYKDNTSEDFSFEFIDGQVKHEGNTIVSANEKGVTPVLNKTIAKDNLSKYLGQLDEKKGKDLDGDGDVDSDDYLLAKDKAIKANMKEEETEFEADAKGKPTGNLRAKLSDKDKKTLKKIEDLLAKEKPSKFKRAGERSGFDMRGIKETEDISEGPYQTTYVKVSKRDYRKAISIIDQNIDSTYVSTDIVDDDGAGNVIIYFNFREREEGDFDENPGEFIYDLSMDLEAHGISVTEKSHDLDEDYDPDQEQLGEEEDKMKEHISVGHPDNEPGMLKQDVHDIAHYAVKLYKLLKYYESLEDQVDFPHWWQSKVVKAREYISKAAHYLEFKTNEPAIDAQVGALQEGRSANAIKKEYDALVSKMIELAKEYKKAEGEEKKQLVAQLKDHTKTKKALEKELEQAVEKTGAGQELDTSINELSTDQRNDLVELQNILDDVNAKGEEAREIIRQSFPNMLSKADAYGAFNFGSSANRYDTTLESIIEEIEEYYDEEDMDEGKYKSDAQRKAIHAKKAELKEEMDGGRLFDYFAKQGYDITERRPDGYPAKEGVVGYQVSRGNDRYPQSVIFQYNTNNNEFTISRMSGYRIDQKEAIKAGMREAGRSGAAGMDSYMTDGNYTPVGISAEGLKDIVDHVMSGLDREGQAQGDFYKDRGPTSGTIDEKSVSENINIKKASTDKLEKILKQSEDERVSPAFASQLKLIRKELQNRKKYLQEEATCCGRCGRVHVKGSGCKRPYLKGKDHCRTK